MNIDNVARQFQSADDAWQCELERQFGKLAGDRRYDDRFNGALPNARGDLCALYQKRMEAFRAWRASVARAI